MRDIHCYLLMKLLIFKLVEAILFELFLHSSISPVAHDIFKVLDVKFKKNNETVKLYFKTYT